MGLFGIRFDFRNPDFAGTSMTERLRAGVEMAEWADERGFLLAVLSEHHGSDDGYLPSALTMAAAIAVRTQRLRIHLGAIVAALHDPVHLAEQVAVVDLLSAGRVDLVLANGYVPAEFEMFGRSMRERAQRTTEAVEVLRQAWTGEPFEYAGRTVRVTPRPHQQPGPAILLGGSSEGAARRAARIADGYLPQSGETWDYYRDECAALGKPDPGPHHGGDTSFIHVADDPDAAWAAIAPYAMHETNAYGAWMAAAGIGPAGGFATCDDPDELRASGQYRVVTPEQLVAEITAAGPYGFTMFHPMMGGIPPELGWASLRLFERDVLPHVAAPVVPSAS